MVDFNKAKDALGNEKVNEGIDKAQEKLDNDKVNQGLDKAQEKFGPQHDNNEEEK